MLDPHLSLLPKQRGFPPFPEHRPPVGCSFADVKRHTACALERHGKRQDMGTVSPIPSEDVISHCKIRLPGPVFLGDRNERCALLVKAKAAPLTAQAQAHRLVIALAVAAADALS